MEDQEARFTALRRGIAALEEDVTKVQRKKADAEDLEAVSKKVSGVETESREKLSNLTSKLNEVERVLNSLVRSVDHLAEALEKQKEELAATPISAPSGTLGGSMTVWERIPKWCYLLMGMGLLALVQQGPGLVVKAQSMGLAS